LIFFSTAIMSSDGALHFATLPLDGVHNREIPSAIHGCTPRAYTHMHSGSSTSLVNHRRDANRRYRLYPLSRGPSSDHQ
jgi:hypothetical protein